MVDIIDFPPSLRISDRADPQIDFDTRSAGPGLGGGEQILSPLTYRWTWRVTIPVRSKADARAMRILKSQMKGRFNYLRMRVCDQYRITRTEIGAIGTDAVPHSDDQYFSDGAGYTLSQPAAPSIGAVAETANTVVVAKSYFSGAMSAGVFFSVNDWLYQVDNWTDDGTNYTLTFSPPAREPIGDGDYLNFNATALWEFADDAEGSLELAIGRFGVASISLIEPIGRRLDAS